MYPGGGVCWGPVPGVAKSRWYGDSHRAGLQHHCRSSGPSVVSVPPGQRYCCVQWSRWNRRRIGVYRLADDVAGFDCCRGIIWSSGPGRTRGGRDRPYLTELAGRLRHPRRARTKCAGRIRVIRKSIMREQICSAAPPFNSAAIGFQFRLCFQSLYRQIEPIPCFESNFPWYGCANSLFLCKGNCARKARISTTARASRATWIGWFCKFPCKFPWYQGNWRGDWLSTNCVVSHPVPSPCRTSVREKMSAMFSYVSAGGSVSNE